MCGLAGWSARKETYASFPRPPDPQRQFQARSLAEVGEKRIPPPAGLIEIAGAKRATNTLLP